MKSFLVQALSVVLASILLTSPVFAQNSLIAGGGQSQATSYTLPESYYNSINQSGTNVATNSAAPETAVTEPAPTQVSGADVTAPPTVVGQPIPEDKSSTSYVLNQIGVLRAEIDEIKANSGKPDAGQLAGYAGGFFIQDKDAKFKLNIGGRFQGRYGAIFAEDIQDVHSFQVRRVLMWFTGNAFDSKVLYGFILALNKPGPFVAGEIAYVFGDVLTAHLYADTTFVGFGTAQSSGKQQFISSAIADDRFNVGDSVGISLDGAIGKFYYYGAVYNGYATDLSLNANNELGFAGRLQYNILNTLSPGESDLVYSEKPGLAMGITGGYTNLEDGTQARLIVGTADAEFKYKGLTIRGEGMWRQTDPDQFTRAQYDVGFVGAVGYFVLPKKLEIVARASALIDDLTDAGVNLNMASCTSTGMKFSGSCAYQGDDIDGDSDNEWQYSGAINYYPFGSYNLKMQGEYTFVIDGIPGPDDRANHIVLVQAQVGF